MEGVWELPEDESEFTQVVGKALAYGPLVLSKDGREVAVVISKEEYRRLKKRQSLSEFFRNSPLGELDLTRDPSLLEPGPEL